MRNEITVNAIHSPQRFIHKEFPGNVPATDASFSLAITSWPFQIFYWLSLLTAKSAAARVDNFLKGIQGLLMGSLVPTWNIRERKTPAATNVIVNTWRTMNVALN